MTAHPIRLDQFLYELGYRWCSFRPHGPAVRHLSPPARSHPRLRSEDIKPQQCLQMAEIIGIDYFGRSYRPGNGDSHKGKLNWKIVRLGITTSRDGCGIFNRYGQSAVLCNAFNFSS